MQRSFLIQAHITGILKINIIIKKLHERIIKTVMELFIPAINEYDF